MFYPDEQILGTVLENDVFSFQVYYEVENTELATVIRFPVEITFNQPNPATVNKTDGDPASIFGFYFDSFNNSMQYRTPQDTFVIVEKFEEIDTVLLSEMIYYLADTRRTKEFTYTAKAIDGDEIIATKTYTIVVQNDWTNGKNSLQTYVGLTR